MTFSIINKQTGKVVETHRSRERAVRAARILNAHEIAHRDCFPTHEPDNSCSRKYLELMESGEPIEGDYYLLEKQER